jgi:hypothetical protein
MFKKYRSVFILEISCNACLKALKLFNLSNNFAHRNPVPYDCKLPYPICYHLRRISLDGVEDIDEDKEDGDEQGHSSRDDLK